MTHIFVHFVNVFFFKEPTWEGCLQVFVFVHMDIRRSLPALVFSVDVVTFHLPQEVRKIQKSSLKALCFFRLIKYFYNVNCDLCSNGVFVNSLPHNHISWHPFKDLDSQTSSLVQQTGNCPPVCLFHTRLPLSGGQYLSNEERNLRAASAGRRVGWHPRACLFSCQIGWLCQNTWGVTMHLMTELNKHYDG